MEELMSRRLNRLNMSLPLRVSSVERPAYSRSSHWRMDPEFECTVTENFSSRGCYFFLSQEPPLGARLELEITIPGESPETPFAKVYCKGRVIRVDRESPHQGWEGMRIGVASTIEASEDVYAGSVPKPMRRPSLTVSADRSRGGLFTERIAPKGAQVSAPRQQTAGR